MPPRAMPFRAYQVFPKKKGHLIQAFTLVEVLVAGTLLVIIIALVLRMTNQTAKVWKDSNSKIQSFQEARAGFDAMTRKVTQATLNTYYDYYSDAFTPPKARVQLTGNDLINFKPSSYDRISSLHFISGQAKTLLAGSPSAIITQTQAVFFQAPLGYSVTYPKMDNALNACGFFLQFSDAASVVPDYYRTSSAYKPRWRYRLMEMMQPTEQLAVYPPSFPVAGVNDWFVKNAGANSRIMAENVIALVILPKLSDRDDDPNAAGKGVSLAPNYNYNSRISLKATIDPTFPSASPAFPPDEFNSYPAKGGVLTVTRHHQLPPILQVVMIVIDEASAQRLQGTSTTVPTAIDLTATNLFTDATKLSADIQSVEDICNAKAGNLTGNTTRLVYRVFTTDILMREAKWSNN